MSEAKKSLQTGDIVFSEGDPGDAMYVVLKGVIQLYRDTSSGRVVLAKLGPGEFFGEMSLIGNTPRTATAISMADTVLASYSSSALESLLGTKPEVGARIIRDLVTRLKDTTDKLTEERKKRLGTSW